MPKPEPSQLKNLRLSLVAVCASFGISLGLEIYVIGVLLGGWVDRRFGCGPSGMITGVCLALIIAFNHLFRSLRHLQRAEDRARDEAVAAGVLPPPVYRKWVVDPDDPEGLRGEWVDIVEEPEGEPVPEQPPPLPTCPARPAATPQPLSRRHRHDVLG